MFDSYRTMDERGDLLYSLRTSGVLDSYPMMDERVGVLVLY